MQEKQEKRLPINWELRRPLIQAGIIEPDRVPVHFYFAGPRLKLDRLGAMAVRRRLAKVKSIPAKAWTER